MARVDARDKAREWFELYPKAAYMTEIEFWRQLDDGRIEFTIRRLPSADQRGGRQGGSGFSGHALAANIGSIIIAR